MTYNIWFEKVTKERIAEVIRVITEADADFICLQEVTEESRTMIKESNLVKNHYLGVGGSISDNDFIVPYGVMIISKYPCLFYEKYFKSKMGRSVLFAEPIVPINLIVATSHFESFGASAYLRKAQMTETFWLLEFA